MARQNIYIGKNDNDGTGDKLRDAMRKVNENFVELYAQTPEATNISLNENLIQVSNTNGNLTLDPNGTGLLLVTTGAVFNTGEQPNSLFTVKDSDGGDVLTINPLYKNVGINTTASTQGLNIAGNLNLVGTSVSLDAELTLGSATKTIAFSGNINSHFIPSITDNYTLGTASKRFVEAHLNDLHVDTITSANVAATDITTTDITVSGETTVGNLVIRDNEISNNVLNEDITINPYGSGNVFINTKLIVGEGGATLTNPVLQAVSNYAGFTQIGVQNINSGVRACSDIIATADDGNDAVHYIDLGINNSGYDGSIQKVYYTIVSGTISTGDTVTQTNSNTSVTVTATVNSTGSDETGNYVLVGAASGRFFATAGYYGNLIDTTSSAQATVNSAAPDYFGFTIGKEHDGYLYMDSGNLTIGTATANKDIIFHGGGLYEENAIMRIKAADQSVIISTTYDPSSSGDALQVHGKIKVTEEIIQTNRTISSSIGAAGDKAGMIASDNDYIYKCTADYDGSTAIWKRASLGTW